MTTLTKTTATIVSSQSVSAGTPVRGAIAISTQMGGVVTIKMTNNASGPSVECSATVHMAHDVSGTPPATSAAGATWKLLMGPFGAGTTSNAVSEFPVEIPWGVGAIQVEFAGNTAQAVTCEAIMTQVASAS